MIGHIGTMLWKDLLSEFRTREMLLSMLIFSLMVGFIFNVAFPPGSEFVQDATPGILWMTFVFASLLGMNRSFVYEVDKGCLHGLMLAPVDRSVIYFSKFFVNLLFILIVELIVLPVFSIFFRLDIITSFWQLLLVMLFGTIGLAAVGTLFSAIAVNTRTREVMLPIMHFPVSIPIIIGSVEGTSAVFSGQDWSVVWGWLKILVAFDVIFLVVSFLTFEFIIEE